ncbi:MAG TPA: cation-binding protein [Actinobacteria bacterium]|nr:cation-binding protein [Actinomycetota bacterium]
MTEVTLAHDEQDARILEQVVAHHEQMLTTIGLRVRALTDAVNAGNDVSATQKALVEYCRTELLPHAKAEEATLYPQAGIDPHLRALVQAMIAEHSILTELVEQLARDTEPGDVAAAAGGLWTLINSHVSKESEYVLPHIATDPDTSLTELVVGLHELVGGGESAEDNKSAGGCGCGCAHTDEIPELDVRAIPHAIRHATVFGALEAVEPGSSLILVAPHDPLPLLNQIDDRHPNEFSVSYLERGPEAWRLQLVRS